MAIKATIFKATLSIADMDRGYYADQSLTLARHPSENDERMMTRVLAFVREASETLEFGKGVSESDEPDLWQKDLTGAIERWIELGHPEEKDVRRAFGRARAVSIYTYNGPASDVWWDKNKSWLSRLDGLTVVNLSAETVEALAGLVERTMQLQCTIQDGQIWLNAGDKTVLVEPEIRKAPKA